MTDTYPQSISSRWYDLGLRWNLLVVIGILGGALYGYVEGFASKTSISASTYFEILGLTVGLGLSIMIGTLFLVATRRVDISSDGVTFVAGFRGRFVAWKELIPPKYPYNGSSIVFRCRVNRERRSLYGNYQPLPASILQAQAILTHPSCPKFKLKNEIWRSLRMDPPRRTE